ncbi:MAG: TspO/MBR family protein, partial [Candidatus Sericytochromatia bacterium]|nr:TspO/MBR family protein [Candidatus Sericytochromatia bacterium]
MTGQGGRWIAPLVASSAAVLVALLGGLLTRLDAWYYTLSKPAFQPPDWLFGPAWTIIFLLCVLAALDVWRRELRPDQRRLILVLFAVNGVLNVAWSGLFFFLKRPDLALLEVVALWLSVLFLVVMLGRHSRRAGLMLVPYLVWVSFAAALNLAIVRLNAPFVG